MSKKRVEWLQKICEEARDTYGFNSLGELVTWMIDDAGEVQLKSGDVNVEVTGCEPVLARSMESENETTWTYLDPNMFNSRRYRVKIFNTTTVPLDKKLLTHEQA